MKNMERKREHHIDLEDQLNNFIVIESPIDLSVQEEYQGLSDSIGEERRAKHCGRQYGLGNACVHCSRPSKNRRKWAGNGGEGGESKILWRVYL
jgi:hypothetical protein